MAKKEKNRASRARRVEKVRATWTANLSKGERDSARVLGCFCLKMIQTRLISTPRGEETKTRWNSRLNVTGKITLSLRRVWSYLSLSLTASIITALSYCSILNTSEGWIKSTDCTTGKIYSELHHKCKVTATPVEKFILSVLIQTASSLYEDTVCECY